MVKSPPDSLIENKSQLNYQLLTKSLFHCNCYHSVFRCIKPNEQLDQRRNTFVIQCAEDSSMKYFSVEESEELVKIKNAWHRANYYSVTQLGVSVNS